MLKTTLVLQYIQINKRNFMKKILLWIFLLVYTYNTLYPSYIDAAGQVIVGGMMLTTAICTPSILIIAIRNLIKNHYKINEIKKQNFADNNQEYIIGDYEYLDCDPEFIRNPDKLGNKVFTILRKDFNQEMNYAVPLPTIQKKNYGYFIYKGNWEETSHMQLKVNTKSNTIHATFKIYPLHARLIRRQENSILDALNQTLEKELKASKAIH